jgi:hypothetical protein
MHYDLSIIARAATDRHHTFLSTAHAGYAGPYRPAARPALTPLERSFGTYRRRRSAWGRRWPT